MNRRTWFAAAAATLTLVLTPAVRAAAAPELAVSSVDVTAPGRASFTLSTPPELLGQDLPASAWTVRESGKKVPLELTALPTDASQVVLAIDTSGSMRGNAMEAAKAAATTFVERMPDSVSVAVVAFGDRPVIVNPLTADRAATSAAIASLAPAGETAFYDGLETASSIFEGDTQHSVVALTDGKDTASAGSLESAAQRLADAKAGYYGIALATADGDLSAVEQIANLTNGRATTAGAPGALENIYRGVASRITSQYRVEVPTTRSGSTGFTFAVKANGVTATGQTRVALPALDAPASAAPKSEPITSVAGDDPAWFQQPTALWLGLGVLFAGLLAGLSFAFAPRAARSQLQGSKLKGVRNGTSVLTSFTNQATQLAERQLARNDRGSRLNFALARAGLAVRPSEFVVIVATATFAMFALTLLLIGPLAALIAAAIVPFAGRGVISHLGQRRSDRFQDQLEQTIPLLAGSLRAGFGVMQAFDAVARESEAPTSDEFHRVVVESRLGRELNDALAAMAERIDSEDFHWVVQAIEIHRQVGGDLAEVLDNVYSTIRDRNRIRRQIKALSAEGRLSALILFILPCAMFGVIAILNPDYLGELTGNPLGIAMLLAAAGMLAVGGLWLRRITRLVF